MGKNDINHLSSSDTRVPLPNKLTAYTASESEQKDYHEHVKYGFMALWA